MSGGRGGVGDGEGRGEVGPLIKALGPPPPSTM